MYQPQPGLSGPIQEGVHALAQPLGTNAYLLTFINTVTAVLKHFFEVPRLA